MTRPPRRVLRCAVYTRKSSEEGLDQAFNSLDAQREAGLAYIASQRHEGWASVKAAYDEGGRSGGSMERPALQRLLDDVRKGRIDVVVVYKVDRLSRSLADFARLMQVFDEHGVSFVSVTQQFNTTTSMGRLTLNMLLSFAQFEREVAGERIRDKIAATKRRGVWVCGRPPLGYRLPREGDPDHTPGDRTLRIVGPEAALVRAMYDGFLELGSLVELARRLNAARRDDPQGVIVDRPDRCARTFTTPFLRRVLTNHVYIGMITHTPGSPGTPGSPSGTPATPGNVNNTHASGSRRGSGRNGVKSTARTEVHQGLHEPIIAQDVWDRVQARFAAAERETYRRWTHSHLLKGKVRTHEGHALSPGSVQRPASKRAAAAGGRAGENTRLVRYYVSQKALKRGFPSCPIKSINAARLDDLVRGLVLDHLRGQHGADLRALEPAVRDGCVREVVHGVTLAPDRITIELDRDRVAACVGATQRGRDAPGSSSMRGGRRVTAEPASSCLYTPEVEERGPLVALTLRIQIKLHDGKRMLLSPDGRDLLTTITPDGRRVPSEHLVRAVGLAFAWRRELLVSGGTIESIARCAGVVDTRMHAMLALTRLSPSILRAVLTGELGPSVTLADLMRAARHLDWSRQARLLGI